MRGLAQLLTGRPPQRVEGSVVPASIASHYDRVGLPRIEVTVNGQAQEAVVDTGANLSVLSRDTARRMGIQVAEAETRVANAVRGTVGVRIGVADRLEIAGTVLRDVPFLIVDDEHLTFPLPGGYDIRAIIGFPVLRALKRFRIEHEGRFSVLPVSGERSASPNLHASGNDLFVDVAIAGRNVPLHLDTGADETTLSARYTAANPAAVAGLQVSERRSASAGGTRSAQVATWRNASIGLAGRTLVLPSLPVHLPATGRMPRFNGTLGSNALRAFRSYTIDYAAMRLELGEPLGLERRH
jgi:clan AA aspartic protease (TIGR02281 family)